MENVNGNENRRPGKQPENPRPPPETPPPRCPRCESIYTKFCYYNNYSANQPRYLCKTCKRYWTHGGSLRNVPIGGGTRKGSKKSKIVSGATASSSSGGEISSSRADRPPLAVPLQPPLSLQRSTGSLVNLTSSFMSNTDFFSSIESSMPSRPQFYNYNHLMFTGIGARSTTPLMGNSTRLSGGVGGSGGAGTSHLALLQSFGRNQNYQRQPLVNANPLPFYQPQQRQESESERRYQLSGSDQRMMMVPQLSNSRQTIIIQNNQPSINNSNSGSNNDRTSLSWAQARMAIQQQNRESAGTSRVEPPTSLVIQNQWPDDDDEDVRGYGPLPPPS